MCTKQTDIKCKKTKWGCSCQCYVIYSPNNYKKKYVNKTKWHIDKAHIKQTEKTRIKKMKIVQNM